MHLVPFMAGFHSTTSDPEWGLRLKSRTFSFFSFKESFIIEQHLLVHTDFLFVISDLRAHPQGGTKGQNLGHL